MADLVLQRYSQYSWVRYIHQRISNNKNFICFISGPTGSGKSYCSLSMAELIDPDFNEDRVIFKGLELMKLINSGSLKKGSAIIFEEAGVEMNNKNWQSSTNKLLNYLMQTFRHKNFIIIFNSPYMDFLDAATRKLIHAEFRTININKKEQTVKVKPQLIQYNGRNKKFYYKYLRSITPSGVMPISAWKIPKPSNELIKLYEIKKNEFTSKLNEKIMSELEKQDKVEKPKELTEIQQEIVNNLKDGLSIDEIAIKRGCHCLLINRQNQLIQKKGILITPIKEKGSNRVLYYDVKE